MTRRSPQELPRHISLAGQRGPKGLNDLWGALLPRARQRLVDAGLFDSEGNLTSRGQQELKSGHIPTLRGFGTAVLLVVVALSVISARAATCLSSAESVKHAFPGSWPSWSTRQDGHRGSRCWFPKGHVAMPTKQVASEPRRVKLEIVHPTVDSTRLAAMMGTLGWTFRNRTAVIGPVASLGLFSDRFPVPSDLSSTSRPSILQRLMDPTGVVP